MWNVFLRTAKATFLTIPFLIPALFANSQPVLSFTPLVTTGLTNPVDVVADPAGRLFIVEQGGTIRIYNGTSLLPTPFLTLGPSVIVSGGERGLLSLAFHPSYATNRYFFLLYNNTAGDITLARYQAQAGNPDLADATSGVVLLNIPKPFTNHNGGDINFGPDGYLYFGTGDGGDANDPFNNAQNGNSLLGKMLRLDVSDFAAPAPYYSIPPDNPFIASPVLDEIVALGLRNPWRWSFDRANGDMWIADVGQGALEEVNHVPEAGILQQLNFGWDCFEGSQSTPGVPDCTPAFNYIPPVFEYPHNSTTGGFSITGGFVYRGTNPANAALTGYFICADYVSGNVWIVRPDGSSVRQAGLPGNISSFGEDNNGEIYALSRSAGDLFRVDVSTVLPLELLSFTGKNFSTHNDLYWMTTGERDVERFIIETGTDGRHFTAAGEIPALNNDRENTYTFRHIPADRRTWFYRLKIQHSSGQDTYSAIIELGKDRIKAISVYPTVITNGQLNINSPQAIQEISLYNSDGRQAFRRNMNNQQGYMSVPLPSLPKGMYYLHITGSQERSSVKIIIQ